MSRSLLQSIIILGTVILPHVFGNIELAGPLLGNPPSVFNYASGGVFEYFHSKEFGLG